MGIARTKYGVSNAPQTGSFDKKRGTDAVFARIDWQLNEKNLLTIRDNFINDRNELGRDDNTAINLYEVLWRCQHASTTACWLPCVPAIEPEDHQRAESAAPVYF